MSHEYQEILDDWATDIEGDGGFGEGSSEQVAKDDTTNAKRIS